MAVLDKSDPSDTPIFKRGNPGNLGEIAPRRFLEALSKPGSERPLWKNGSGRFELAKSIASKDDPLTARVFVNRVWQGHFGAGLVRTPSDFGRQGEAPTHPELLDYLASTFMENGWSMKKLLRLIVMSNTYKQTSAVTIAKRDADPDNRLLGRMNRRRLDLEQMRDSALFGAGKLDLSKIGGPSGELWASPYSTRRAVYGFVDRQNLPGTFRTFDFASPDSTSARRFQTTVPQQALFWLNSPFSAEQANSISAREELRTSDEKVRVTELYKIVLCRNPDPLELQEALSYLHKPVLEPVRSAWTYGYGQYDPVSHKVISFTEMSNFGQVGYHATNVFPDATLGYILLNGAGGHPGNDVAHSVIRRWKSPITGVISISGRLSHGQQAGDGVQARVFVRGETLLGSWTAKNSKTPTVVDKVEVKNGEFIDFVIDPRGGPDSDSFGWQVVVADATGGRRWDSTADFGPPPGAAPSRFVLLAQALLMTNEFMFVD